MSCWKRKSAASVTKRSASASVRPWAYAFGDGRCIPLAALQLEGQPRVVRWLIGPRKNRQRRMRGLDVGIRQFEAVEAAAGHGEQLIAAHIARCAQLAAELPLFAQYARLRVTAPFAGSGKIRADQGNPRDNERQQ